jgi:hypothetical protein
MPQWQWHGINKSIRGCIRGKMAMQDKMCLRLKEWNKGGTSGSLSSIFKGNWRYLDYIEIKWVEAYAVFIIQNKELSCSCRILASPAAPPQILDRHPNHQVGLIIFGPKGRNRVPWAGRGGAATWCRGAGQQWSIISELWSAVGAPGGGLGSRQTSCSGSGLAGEQVDNACTGRRLDLIKSIIFNMLEPRTLMTTSNSLKNVL